MADRDLLAEIEQGALDSSTDLADLLRKCITLGGATGSTELRAWAAKELKGYEPTEEFPAYRVAQAPLYLNGATATAQIAGQQVPYSLLPEEVREGLQDIRIHQSVAEIADLISSNRESGAVRLSPPQPDVLVELINHNLYQQEDPQWRAMGMPRRQVVDQVYWKLNVSFFVGILDTIRTTLVELVAEMRAGTPVGQSLPTPEIAEQAVSVAIYGKGHRVVIQQQGAAAVAAATTGVGTASAGASGDPEGFWRRWMWWIVAVATIVGAVAAVLALYL